MTGLFEILNAVIATAVALWALYSLPTLAKPAPARALWIGMVALSVCEWLHTQTVYAAIDQAVTPGVSSVLYHWAGLVAAVAVFQILHGLLGQSRRAKIISFALGLLAMGLAALPVLVPPAVLPARAPEDPVIYGTSWQLIVHWTAFLAYLSASLVFASWQCAQYARTAGPGGLRISMALISAGTGVGLFYVLAHITVEASSWSGASGTWLARDGLLDVLTLGTSIGLIVAGASWQPGAGLLEGARRYQDARSISRRLAIIRPRWDELIMLVPEASFFADQLRSAAAPAAPPLARRPLGTLWGPMPCPLPAGYAGRPARPQGSARATGAGRPEVGGASGRPTYDHLHWQQTRLVIEIYDAMRRLIPYLADEERLLVAGRVQASGLEGEDARAAESEICLALAIRRRQANAPVAPTRVGDPEIPAATAGDAAQQIASTLRRAQRPRVRAVTTAILERDITS